VNLWIKKCKFLVEIDVVRREEEDSVERVWSKKIAV
jgi:hypothetical protein